MNSATDEKWVEPGTMSVKVTDARRECRTLNQMLPYKVVFCTKNWKIPRYFFQFFLLNSTLSYKSLNKSRALDLCQPWVISHWTSVGSWTSASPKKVNTWPKRKTSKKWKLNSAFIVVLMFWLELNLHIIHILDSM